MINKSIFGKTDDGKEVYLFTIKNKDNIEIRIISYGAIVTNIFTPDKDNIIEDIVLGYDSLKGYLNDKAFIGAIVGRYGNRIANGKFKIGKEEYILNQNDGINHLHGGVIGFNKCNWNSETISDSSIKLSVFSKDGDEGYPGNLNLSVTYSLNDENELILDYEGNTDKVTILNPTHHSYFNLTGNFDKTILGHLLKINSDSFLPVDKGQIPLGYFEKVTGTPMDFRSMIPIGLHINENYEQLKIGGGYDHNWILNDYDGKVRKVVEVFEPASGRFMEVSTDQPGMQFYSGNSLDENVIGKNRMKQKFRSGLCLEAQFFPDSPNHNNFPSTILRPGEIYRQKTIYKFSIKKF